MKTIATTITSANVEMTLANQPALAEASQWLRFCVPLSRKPAEMPVKGVQVQALRDLQSLIDAEIARLLGH